jgi:hypothetical protein
MTIANRKYFWHSSAAARQVLGLGRHTVMVLGNVWIKNCLRLFLFSILLCNSVLSFCQIKSDTLIIDKSRSDKVMKQHLRIDYDDSDKKIFKMNGRRISESEYNYCKYQKDSISKYTEMAEGKYCKVYSKGVLISEGIWDPDSYIGPFKKYYRCGEKRRVKLVGEYDYHANKVGKWIWYRKNGKVRKIKEFQK